MTEATAEQIVHLDPSHILAERGDNIRYGLKATAVDELKASILENGGVLQPVRVAVVEGVKGKTHRLLFGYNRHEAVSQLNADGAGLSLPCIVTEGADEGQRTRLQIAENNDRENLSPMDKAVAIQKLMDAGVERAEIRRIFSASGGRKGNTVQPMSNAMMNILLALLALPKSIQEKIHNGLVGVEAAYMLGKVPAEKRADVLERAEAERLKLVTMEENDEAKLLKQEQKIVELEQKVVSTKTEAENAQAEVTAAEELVKAKIEAMKEVKIAIAGQDAPAGPAEVERIKAAEADVKGAQKTLKDAKNALAKHLKTANDTADLVKATREKLEKARKDAKKGKKVGKGDIKKAAAAVGTTTGIVPLNIGDIRQAVKDLAAGKSGADDRTAAIATVFKDCFDGRDTEKQTAERLNRLLDSMGAVLPKKAPAAPPAAPDVKQGPKAAAKK